MSSFNQFIEKLNLRRTSIQYDFSLSLVGPCLSIIAFPGKRTDHFNSRLRGLTKHSFFTSKSFHTDWAIGSCIFLCANLISWSSKKQATMARYHVEVEYHANGFYGSLACNFPSKMFEFDLNNCLNCCVGDNINPVFL